MPAKTAPAGQAPPGRQAAGVVGVVVRHDEPGDPVRVEAVVAEVADHGIRVEARPDVEERDLAARDDRVHVAVGPMRQPEAEVPATDEVDTVDQSHVDLPHVAGVARSSISQA